MFLKKCAGIARLERISREMNLVEANNVERFYRYVNSMLFSHSPLTNLTSKDNLTTSDPVEIADIFNNYFTGVLLLTMEFALVRMFELTNVLPMSCLLPI